MTRRHDGAPARRRIVVAAYGGSLDAAAAIASLGRRLDADAVTVTLDMGQRIDLEQAREQALSAGAVRAHVVDARAALAGHIVRPALMAGAFDGGPLAVAVSRPLIAAQLVSVARMEGATDLAHGATGRDRARLARLIADLAPEMTIHTLENAPPTTGLRVDEHLWGRTVTLPVSGDAANSGGRLFIRTHAPEAFATEPAIVEISLTSGLPVAVNGVALEIEELIEVVDTIAGDHGVGRHESIRDAERVVVESPASVVLSTAVATLASAVLGQEMLARRASSGEAYRALLDDGGWHSPARAELDACTTSTAGELTGAVRLRLMEGECRVIGHHVGQPKEFALEAGAR
jgi:argininosuccinate synthase